MAESLANRVEKFIRAGRHAVHGTAPGPGSGSAPPPSPAALARAIGRGLVGRPELWGCRRRSRWRNCRARSSTIAWLSISCMRVPFEELSVGVDTDSSRGAANKVRVVSRERFSAGPGRRSGRGRERDGEIGGRDHVGVGLDSGDGLSCPETLVIDEGPALAPQAGLVAESMAVRTLVVPTRAVSFRLEQIVEKAGHRPPSAVCT